MCGLNGFVAFDGFDPAALASRMAQSLDRMALRGPDGAGEWNDGTCALGHRRLAIVDLNPTGDQPMVRDRHAIVFNGMIYNYRTLRDELTALGSSFQSDSDTEVILEGWKAWGEGLLPRLQGMFVFAIWERQHKRLTVARDRFGKKPLVYRAANGRFAFASDLRALQLLEGDKGAVDAEALRWFFTLRYIPLDRSILQGVRRLLPGELVVVDADGDRCRQWYQPSEEIPGAAPSEEDTADQLRMLIRQSVADRLVADVPVGAFLSGGIDSAIVAACMVAHGHDTHTFTVGFAGATPYYEERPAAQRVATHLGCRHTEIEVAADDAIAAIDAVFDGLDEPFADSSAIPTYLVSRETRRHVTVALSGDGADEVFGGYRKYQGELRARQYQALPGPLRRGLIEPLIRQLPEKRGDGLREKLRRLKRFARQAGKPAAERQAGWMSLMGDDEQRVLLNHPAPDLAAVVATLRSTAGDAVNDMLRAELSLGLPGDMLTKVDRMSMANGLEVRCPMLDHRVVEFAVSLPGAMKVRKGNGKAILRKAFAGELPPETFALPKKGFEIPIAQWLTGPLRDVTEAAIDPVRLKDQGLFDPALPGRWFADLQSGRRDTVEMLWSLISFQAWQQRQDALIV